MPAADEIPFSIQDPQKEVLVRVVLGPRDNWFDPQAMSDLTSATWLVDARSDGVGLRLVGPGLERRIQGELASEGMVKGAVQVSSNGQPIASLNDHPVTGGYPLIAVVIGEDQDVLAQCRPGQAIRFMSADEPVFVAGRDDADHSFTLDPSPSIGAAFMTVTGVQAVKRPLVAPTPLLFTTGGIATPADAAVMMQLGAEGVFVGSGIFKAGNPAQRAEAIVKATTFFDDPTWSPRSPGAWARPWAALTSTRSRSRTDSPSAAGDR